MGGVIGGLALILIAGTLIVLGILKKRRRLRQNLNQDPPSSSDNQPDHLHSISDLSQKYPSSNVNGSHAMVPQPLQMTVQRPVPIVNPGAANVVSLSSPSMDQFGVQNMASGLISPEAMPLMIFPGPQPAVLSQLPTVGDTPAGGIVTRAPPTTSHGQQSSLEEIITPFRSTQPSPRTDTGRETPPSTADYSDVSSITPASQLGRRRNPPAYTAKPRAGERQAAAPTAPEDARVKYEYGPNANTSRREPEPSIHEDLEYIDSGELVPLRGGRKHGNQDCGT